MSDWIDFVKKVQKRDATTYSNALKVASAEWKQKRGTKSAATPQERKLRKMDMTKKRRNDITVDKKKHSRKSRAYDAE